MKRYVCSLLVAVVALALAGLRASAQDTSTQHPMFKHPVPVYDNAVPPTTALQTWNGSFTYQGHNDKFVMVGTDPSATNTSTTVNAYIIPLKVTVTKNGTPMTFDPATKLSSGLTVTQQVVKSPIFQNLDYNQGGTDIGTTQYEDAFQRGNFWTNVMTNANYHVMFKTFVLPEVNLVVPAGDGQTGTTPYGPNKTLGIISYGWFQQIASKIIAKFPQITPAGVPIFLTYDVYLSETNGFSGCCIGGYHDAYGNAQSPQTYAQFSFMDQGVGSTGIPVFSSDVSALSHEMGEWMDDPYIDNTQGACGGILEVGDPLEGETQGPDGWGDYTYNLNNYNYHVQDLVFLKYFGQTPATSVNNWWSFQGETLSVCSNGQ